MYTYPCYNNHRIRIHCPMNIPYLSRLTFWFLKTFNWICSNIANYFYGEKPLANLMAHAHKMLTKKNMLCVVMESSVCITKMSMSLVVHTTHDDLNFCNRRTGQKFMVSVGCFIYLSNTWWWKHFQRIFQSNKLEFYMVFVRIFIISLEKWLTKKMKTHRISHTRTPQ